MSCASHLRRGAFVLAGAGVAILALAGAASAHIGITPGSAPAGSAAELTFRVPNEEATAATVEVQVKIPTDHPIAQLLVQPVPGWQVSVQTITLRKPVSTDDGTFSTAVSLVTWSGGKIEPGQYQDFSVSADPLPTGVGQLAFKAIQTYSNGDVVRWIDVPQPGISAPEHPAPFLTLIPAGTSGGGGTATVTTGVQSDRGDGTAALALGAGGLATGLIGLAFGIAAWRRPRPRKGVADLAPGTTTTAEERVSP
jgi:periplasmic copper chaperone A